MASGFRSRSEHLETAAVCVWKNQYDVSLAVRCSA
jgi:hypothetical protein